MSEAYSFASGKFMTELQNNKAVLCKVQNKMHAVRGHTAAELIYERADANKPHMGRDHMGSSTGNAFVEAYRHHIWIWQKICRAPYTYDNGRWAKRQFVPYGEDDRRVCRVQAKSQQRVPRQS